MSFRPVVESPNRTFAIGAMIGGGALIASIAAAVIVRMPDDPPPAAPVAKVVVTPAAPIVVPVTITPPAPPPPAPPPPAPEPAPIRATSPHLQAECVLQNGSQPESCTWDHGFPAISADGQTIVREHQDDDGGRGNANLTIQFLDVATSKVTKEVRILSSDEAETPENPENIQPKIAARVATAQKLIDAGEYRTLVMLTRADDALPGTRLRVETSGSMMRVIDNEARTELVRVNYDVPHKVSENECSGFSPLGDIPAWWDAETRTLLTTVYYAYGGCMCGGETRAYARRVR